MQEFFPISDKREDNFICGLSMGGYGSMKVGLTKAENYSAIGCFSAGNFTHRNMDKAPALNNRPGKISLNRTIFSVEDMNDLKNTEHDLFYLAQKNIEEGKPLPKIFHACGKDDFLIDNARLTVDWFHNTKYDYTYLEGPGAHTWEYWDEWITEV